MQTTEGLDLLEELRRSARIQGRDLGELMEDNGFLLTATRHRQLKVETLVEMLYILSRETSERLLQRYLGGRPSTAQDMFDAVLQWLEDYRDALAAGHVG